MDLNVVCWAEAVESEMSKTSLEFPKGVHGSGLRAF